MRPYFLLILLCPFISFGMPQKKQDFSFSDKALAELHHLCQQIIRHFPPDRYFYIGVGRSPSPIIAWLQANYGNGAATQIPLSDFHLCRIDGEGRIKSEARFPSEDAAVKLFHHFDKYLRAEVASDRRWLVIDTVMSGNTLKSAAYALTEYLYAHDQVGTPVEMLGIAEVFGDAVTAAEPYEKLGMSVALVSQSAEEDKHGIWVTTPLESQLLHGEALAMAPFGALLWKHFLKQGASCPEPEPGNLKAYYYLLARIYFWVAMSSLTVWRLFVTKQ